jgi:very-short-patch-repair endonuclease
MSRSSYPRQEQLATYARQMRLCPTLSEARLWQALRGGRLGVAFRRQAVIGGYIVDFLAPRERLVVEVDGAYHARRGRADERRDRYLRRAGYRVLRFEVQQVMTDLRRVIELIVEQLD